MLCIFPATAKAQMAESMRSVSLDSVVITSQKYTSSIRNLSHGVTKWDLRQMEELPKILGNADPIHYSEMLPGVQTNGEFANGVHMMGSESSHNMLSISDVPIYNVSHMLGFFSIFNATHYPSMSIYKSATTAAAPNRLGGELTMQLPADIPDTLSADLSVGLISTQGTVRLPLGPRTALFTSLRGSFMDLLYGPWLRIDGNQLHYSFFDANATLLHHIDNRNTLLFDTYAGMDAARFGESDYQAEIHSKWGNAMAALHWVHNGSEGLQMKNTAYFTTNWNRLKLQMPEIEFRLPSHIMSLGFKNSVAKGRWQGGADVVRHYVQPQNPDLERSYGTSKAKQSEQHATEMSLFANYTQPLVRNLSAGIGVRGTGYYCSPTDGSERGAWYWSADPSATVTYGNDRREVSLTYSVRHQYLFQTGFSSMGLPTEFWLAASARQKPQYAHGVTLAASSFIFGKRYRISIEAHYKRLSHQLEYRGTVLDFINSEYALSESLLNGKGTNYGFDLMLNKCYGRLTGWICYTYTQADRSFPLAGMNGNYPAKHERPHEINAVATYSLKKHWSFSATFVHASGTPFTAPVNMYLLNGNIVSEYGEHNGNRLHPYQRLDLSANYKWATRKGMERGMNLSLYNALCHENELFYYVKQNRKNEIYYNPVTFMLPILPSISFFCKF